LDLTQSQDSTGMAEEDLRTIEAEESCR